MRRYPESLKLFVIGMIQAALIYVLRVRPAPIKVRRDDLHRF